MTTTSSPMISLLWKEYRTMRGFWLALAAIVCLLQGAILWFGSDPSDSAAWVYRLAMIAPSLFALGGAGAAFASEREDGTIDHLLMSPVTPRLVFLCKVLLIAVGALALLAVLWGMSVLITGGVIPEGFRLYGESHRVGQEFVVWSAFLVEAVAWGILFSLYSSRPLAAICLAVATSTTLAHVCTWQLLYADEDSFSAMAYARSSPWRLLMAVGVLAWDASVGWQWLHRGTSTAISSPCQSAPSRLERYRHNFATATSSMTGMLGRLLWIDWRQSRGSMLLFLLLTATAMLLSGKLEFRLNFWLPSWRPEAEKWIAWLVPWSTMAGVFVFRSDQDRRQYRFYIEHSVPPRYVWLARHMMWVLLLGVGTAIVVALWIAESPDISVVLFRVLPIPTRGDFPLQWQQPNQWALDPYFYGEPLVTATFAVVLAYAAGQYASMFVRSAIMAGLLGFVLSGVLQGWLALMITMQADPLWTIVPLPLILLWGTWLRAPDWIRDDTSWRARVKALAAVAIPAALLMLAVGWHRVHDIPIVQPTYDRAKLLSDMEHRQAATEDLRDRLRSIAESVTQMPNEWSTEKQASWLQANAEPLNSLVQTALEPGVRLPREHNDQYLYILTSLAYWSGDQLQEQGDLDAALDRLMLATTLRPIGGNGMEWHFSRWAARQGQTSARIRSGIERVKTLNVGMWHLNDWLLSQYQLSARVVRGDTSAYSQWYGTGPRSSDRSNLMREHLWCQLMPWERHRAQRLLNLMESVAIERLQFIQQSIMENRNDPLVDYLVPPEWTTGEQEIGYFLDMQGRGHGGSVLTWLDTTRPDLQRAGDYSLEAAEEMVSFETDRRAAMLVMAAQAYRLDHGQLPETLRQLVPDYLGQLPHDPYSGRPFVYLPNGLAHMKRQSNYSDNDHFSLPRLLSLPPFLWSTGSNLAVDDQTDRSAGRRALSFRGRDWPFSNNRHRLDWSSLERSGRWFEIFPPAE